MRRRIPWWVLALLFVVVPVLEIYVLIQVGQVIGAWWTILLLVADGFLGSWLMKREGTRAWGALREALESRRMPARELADGALILVGGTLLLTPGFLSDFVGFFFVLPFTRPVARRALTRFLTRKFLSGPGAPGSLGRMPSGTGAAGPAGAPGPGPRTRQRPGPDSVVQGEVVD
jgi:UPF0716 protein FxsA